MQAILPSESPARFETIDASATCGCAECARAHGLRIHLGDEIRFHASGLCGPGENAYEQTLGMFGLAEKLLQQAGMEFRDVMRTWIHLREMDCDYGDLNRARREFFEARGIDPVPASTGIGGGPVSDAHDLCLGVYAVKADAPSAADRDDFTHAQRGSPVRRRFRPRNESGLSRTRSRCTSPAPRASTNMAGRRTSVTSAPRRTGCW